MAQATDTAEPTMEEILASIRRIIAEDPDPNDDSDVDTAALPTEDDDLSAWDADAELEDPDAKLSQNDLDALFDDDEEEDVTDEEVSFGTKDDVAEDDDFDIGFDETDSDDDTVDFSPKIDEDDGIDVLDLSPSQAVEVDTGPDYGVEPLVGQVAEGFVVDHLNLLSNLIVPGNARTIEDLVKELLRPMLKAYLDQNLPAMTERLVKQEIQRISRGGSRK